MAIRETSTDDVFINCPFDDDYAPIFRALIFAIYACSFRARSAREMDDGGQVRIEKLYSIIEECRFGIHDLSRTELDEANGLPRFNMPLELGMFLGDVEPYRYQRFISDLAGMDIHAHGGDPIRALRETRDWLANVSRRAGLPSADRLERLYRAFQGELPDMAARFEFDPATIPYVDFERLVAGWLVEATPPE